MAECCCRLSARAARDCWPSFLLIRKHRIGSHDFVLTSRFLRVLIELFIVSCKTLSWREEPSIGLWSIIFAAAANTSIIPFWYLAFKRNQVSS